MDGQLAGWMALADPLRADAAAAAKLEDVKRRIEKLQRMADSLTDLLHRCQGDKVSRAHCPILQALAPPED